MDGCPLVKQDGGLKALLLLKNSVAFSSADLSTKGDAAGNRVSLQAIGGWRGLLAVLQCHAMLLHAYSLPHLLQNCR